MLNKMMLNLFYNPKNTGRISKPDGIADLYNEDESQHVEFSLRIDSGIIVDCKFRAQATPYIMAICAQMTEMVKGKMISMFFLDPYSIKKALEDDSDINIDFCIDCMRLAISDYKEKMAKIDK
ncbi:MAG: iron-sulfur cluster assembly scaffold protein [Clostridia bacterium]|nr:iron-sulfur cluster assembly scaffold protein [Clostridia bacterium]